MTAIRSIILGDILYLNPKMCLSFHSRNERLSNKSKKEFLNNIVRFFFGTLSLGMLLLLLWVSTTLMARNGNQKNERRKRLKDQKKNERLV
jgi:uncharacterized membrane protein YdcZ (DUF606 family)